jgi:hypothetical protein
MLSLMSASKEEIARAHHAYLDGIDDAQGRIREHLRATGGPDPDGSIESLANIGPWFFEHLTERDEPVSTDWIPAWWDPQLLPAGAGVETHAPLTRQQLRLIDEVHAYVAEVVLNHASGAKWVVYKGGKKDVRNGDTVLQLDKRRQFYPLSLVYMAALKVVLLDNVVRPTIFYDVVRRDIGDAD